MTAEVIAIRDRCLLLFTSWLLVQGTPLLKFQVWGFHGKEEFRYSVHYKGVWIVNTTNQQLKEAMRTSKSMGGITQD